MIKKNKPVLYSFLLITGILILINIFSFKFFFRLDFTADQEYTLSKSSHEILKKLKDPVTITAYFSKDVPVELKQVRSDFNDLLVEYSNLSGNKIKFEFIDPTGKDDLEKKAQDAGIQPVMVDSREKDQLKQQKAYIGAIIQSGENSEILPVIHPGEALEYILSSAIRKLTAHDKPLVGFLQGQGEPSIGALQQVYSELSVMYQVDPVYLSDTSYVLNKYKTIAIVAPIDTVKPSYLQQLDHFLNEGGNLLVAINRVEVDMRQNQGIALNTGFEKWLQQKGIIVNPNFVSDALCNVASVDQGGFVFQIQFPYFPILKTFAKHPITHGLEGLVMQYVSTIDYKGDGAKKFVPLVETSDKSAYQTVPVIFDINKEWKESDFPAKNLTIAAAITGTFGNNKPAKMIVIADGDFAVNGEGQKVQQINPDNVNFFVNAMDWLSDDTGLIELRTKAVTMRPIDKISDSSKLLLKILNFSLPILLIIGYGLWRMNNNRNIRLKRMEEGYF